MTEALVEVMARAIWASEPFLGDSEEAITMAQAALQALSDAGYEVVVGWQPIATAPRGGVAEMVDIWAVSSRGGELFPRSYWDKKDGWIGFFGRSDNEPFSRYGFTPTHWRKEPSGPVGEASAYRNENERDRS